MESSDSTSVLWIEVFIVEKALDGWMDWMDGDGEMSKCYIIRITYVYYSLTT